MPRILTLAAALFAVTSTVAIAAPAMVGQTAKGQTLTDARGMTLYTFDKDANGKSACNGACAEKWPPLKAEGAEKGSKGYSVVNRDDGSKQWAYKGRPLYTWVNDTKPGDITGDGFLKDVWHVAQP